MKISDETREIAVAQLEAALPDYPDIEQTTRLLQGILSGRDGANRVTTILRGFANENDIGRLNQILPKLASELGESVVPIVDDVLALASRAPGQESPALETAMQVPEFAGAEQTDRILNLTLQALAGGAERSQAVASVLRSPTTARFREAFSASLDERLLADITSRVPDATALGAATYLATRWRELTEQQHASFRRALVSWLDQGPDYGTEVGEVLRELDLSTSDRIPIVRALLRAAESATQASWRADALREANGLAAKSKPARSLVSRAVKRMRESGDPLNVEAVALAGLSLPE
jgi:hypothetical protein